MVYLKQAIRIVLRLAGRKMARLNRNLALLLNNGILNCRISDSSPENRRSSEFSLYPLPHRITLNSYQKVFHFQARNHFTYFIFYYLRFYNVKKPFFVLKTWIANMYVAEKQYGNVPSLVTIGLKIFFIFVLCLLRPSFVSLLDNVFRVLHVLFRRYSKVPVRKV